MLISPPPLVVTPGCNFTGGSSITSYRWLIASILVMSGVMFATKAWVDTNYMGEG